MEGGVEVEVAIEGKGHNTKSTEIEFGFTADRYITQTVPKGFVSLLHRIGIAGMVGVG